MERIVMDTEATVDHRTTMMSTCFDHYWGKTSRTYIVATVARACTLHSNKRWAVSDACNLVTGGSSRRSARVKSRRVKFIINWATSLKMAKSVQLVVWVWRRQSSVHTKHVLEQALARNLIGGVDQCQPEVTEQNQNLLIWSFQTVYMHGLHRRCNLRNRNYSINI